MDSSGQYCPAGHWPSLHMRSFWCMLQGVVGSVPAKNQSVTVASASSHSSVGARPDIEHTVCFSSPSSSGDSL